MSKPFFVYMLRCVDGSFYVGHTDDLDKRIEEHERGGKCLYTSQRRPLRLIWFDEFPTRDEAKAAEIQIKAWSRVKKVALARSSVEALRHAARKPRYRNRKAVVE